MNQWRALALAGALGDPRQREDRSVVFRRGDPAEHAYFLAAGAVEIVQRDEAGASLVVKILVAPSLFGVIEVMGDETRFLESVRVLGAATTYARTAQQFRALVASDAAAGADCLRDMSAAFSVAARFEIAKVHDTEPLLANLFLAYADVVGEREGVTTRLTLKRTQADFAEAIGSGERSVNRALSAFKSRGLIDKSLGRYVIVDETRLLEQAGELAGSLVHPPRAR